MADTAAVESAASQAPLTISLGNGANDGEAGYAGLASTSTPGEFGNFLPPTLMAGTDYLPVGSPMMHRPR